MKKLIFVLSLVFALLLMFACNEEQGVENTNKVIGVGNPHYSNVMSGPTQTFYSDSPLLPAHCAGSPKDCFPEIIVTPEKKIEDIILTNHIYNNTVYQYFQEDNQEHYEILFPNFSGPALLDLRNNITTLRKIINLDSTVNYYFVFVNDTTNSPDYSDFY